MPHNVGGHCYTVYITKGKLMPECEVCQHRDSVYMVDVDYGRIIFVCATCIKIFPDGIIVAEADTRLI